MSEQDIFNTPTQEAARLAGELAEVKSVLREMLRRVASIEARAKRAFPGAFPKLEKTRISPLVTEAPTMTADEVMQIYDEVVEKAKLGDVESAQRRLDHLGLGDLNLLRSELGVSMKKRKPSKPAILDLIWGRVNESVMLTKHTNRQDLISKAEQPEK